MSVNDERDCKLADKGVSNSGAGPTSDNDDHDGPAANLRQRANCLPSYLSLSRVVATVGFLSFWAYVFLYQLSFGYLGKFGATPEEVGLDQATYVVHAALLASVGAFIASVAFIVVGGVTMSMAGVGRLLEPTSSGDPPIVAAGQRVSASIGTHIWSRGVVGSLRRKTTGLVIGVSVLVYLSLGLNPGYVANPFRGSSNAVASFVLVLAILCAVFWVLARWRWIACVLAGLGVIVAATVTAAQSLGDRLAEDVIADRSTPLPLSYFALQGDAVRVQVLNSPSRSGLGSPSNSGTVGLAMPGCLYLLGHSDGVLLLTDDHRLYRVNDRAVILVQSADGRSCAVH